MVTFIFILNYCFFNLINNAIANRINKTPIEIKIIDKMLFERCHHVKNAKNY